MRRDNLWTGTVRDLNPASGDKGAELRRTADYGRGVLQWCSCLPVVLGTTAILVAPAAVAAPGDDNNHPSEMTSTAIRSPTACPRVPTAASLHRAPTSLGIGSTSRRLTGGRAASHRTVARSAATPCRQTLRRAPIRPSPTPVTRRIPPFRHSDVQPRRRRASRRSTGADPWCQLRGRLPGGGALPDGGQSRLHPVHDHGVLW